MVLRLCCTTMAVAALIAVFCACSQPATAAERVTAPTQMFHNYYTSPAVAGGVGAQLYVSPRPTPPMVGHTYITYQPLMPHEFLYRHSRAYYKYHSTGQITRTKIRWR